MIPTTLQLFPLAMFSFDEAYARKSWHEICAVRSWTPINPEDGGSTLLRNVDDYLSSRRDVTSHKILFSNTTRRTIFNALRTGKADLRF